MILATDMARHGEILEGFRKVVECFDTKNPEHLVKLKMMLIKACDISNEVRPMDVSGPWVECLLEEYFQQVFFSFEYPPHSSSPFTFLSSFLSLIL